MTAPERLPAVIDHRFVLEAEHKRGGMGTVWRARDLVTSRQVAVKILHAAGADLSERFVREAFLLSQLAHANVVSYIADGLTDEGVPYLAMEWLDGENVAERLSRQPLTLAESLTLVRSAARGLSVAHRAGIVHRDLKPSNLFLRRHRVDDVVLLDLGIARQLGAANTLTRTGAILGTPSYMAPEQAQGHVDVRPAADVFSLGCMLFEFLAGAPPFTGAHVFTVLAKVLFEDAPRLRDLRPEIPSEVDSLVDQMLAKDPARRLADAGALVAAVGSLGVLPHVDPPAGSHAPPRPTPREQELVGVVLATPGSPVAGAASLEERLEQLMDVSAYGAEQKRLADGTLLVTLAQRGGAATDLAIRAARCALRVRDRWPSWRIVLATGRGVPSERIHVGEAVDRAGAMLRSHAEAPSGAIRIDEITAGLLDARFRTRKVGEGAIVLEGEDPSIDPTRRLLGRPTACVGREQELGTLELALRACVEESAPRAVLVVGPPGMGKSRLRHELLRRVQSRGDDLLVLLGQGDPIRSTTTYGLLGGAVSRLCDIRPDASSADARAALEERIGRNLVEHRQLTTVFMGELCGVRYPADATPELRAARQNPRIMADHTTQAWLDFVRAEAAVRPVLLALDDLQWSDALTVTLVDAALRDLGSSPLMVLALARPEVQELFPDLWAPRLAVLPLGPLGPAVSARFVRSVLGDRIGDEGVQRIVSRAAGNALYLEELIRAAEARRGDVPETVVAMLQARIGLLPAATRRVLRAASVFGEVFPVAGVDALLRATATDEEVRPSLTTLSRDEILEPGGEGGDRWRFRHVLMRDAAYGLLTPEDREASHALAARYLEAAGEDAAVIAAHYERGGDRPSALRHYIAAADAAHRRVDFAATIALVQSGLAAGAASEQRGVLRSIEGQARTFMYDFAGSWAATGEALSLLPPGHPRRTQSLWASLYTGLLMGRASEVAGHTEELVRTDPRPEDVADYVAALGFASISHTARAKRDLAARLLARVAEVEARADEAEAHVHSTARYWEARFAELLGDGPYAAWRLAEESVRQCRISSDRRLLSSALATFGDCARRLSLVAEGTAAMREALAVAVALRDPTVRDFVRWYLANLLLEQGKDEDLPEARELARSAVGEAAAGSPYQAFASLTMAIVALRDGDLAAAEAHARGGRETIRALDMRAYYPHADAALLQVLVRTGSPGAAALADEALSTVDTFGPMGVMEVPLRLHAARARLAAGRRQDAARAVADALPRLARQASAIPDPALRERFLSDVPENAALLGLARELGELAQVCDLIGPLAGR
jgi:eukaryotic-like serine/threonine-protein kinase